MPEFLILTEILKNLIFLKPAFSLAVSCISIFVVFILIKVPFSQKFYKVELGKNRSNFTKDLQKIGQNKVGAHKIEKASGMNSINLLTGMIGENRSRVFCMQQRVRLEKKDSSKLSPFAKAI